MLKRIARKEDGFTLIELLVVILIIGVLLAIALPTFLNQQNKGKDAGAKGYVNTAYKALKTESVEDGNFSFTRAQAVSAINASEGGNFAVGGAPVEGTNRVGIIEPEAADPAASSLVIRGVSSGRTCETTVTTSGVGSSWTCTG